MKWLEDELELNALHNPGSRRGNGNEKAAVSQRAALSAALGGRVEVAAMSSISGQLTSLSSFPPSLRRMDLVGQVGSIPSKN